MAGVVCFTYVYTDKVDGAALLPDHGVGVALSWAEDRGRCVISVDGALFSIVRVRRMRLCGVASLLGADDAARRDAHRSGSRSRCSPCWPTTRLRGNVCLQVKTFTAARSSRFASPSAQRVKRQNARQNASSVRWQRERSCLTRRSCPQCSGTQRIEMMFARNTLYSSLAT